MASERTAPPPKPTTLAEFLDRPPEQAGVFIGSAGRLWCGFYDGSATVAIIGGLTTAGLEKGDVRTALHMAKIDPAGVTGWAWEWWY